MNNFVKGTVAFGIIIISLSIGYHFLIFIPKTKLKELDTRKECQEKAIDEAKTVLKERLNFMNTYDSKYKEYQKIIKADMYIKLDFDSYYEKCLSLYGLEK